MPPKSKITREQVMEAALALVREQGIEGVNARVLAKKLGRSTQPLFRLYENMEALKQELRLAMDRVYDEFMNARMKPENRLLTQGMAYVEFARAEKEVFRALFLVRNMAGSSLKDIARAEWNRESIENAGRVTGLPEEGAENLFLNFWLYSHGIASQVLSNEIDLPREKAEELLRKAFAAFLAQERKEKE